MGENGSLNHGQVSDEHRISLPIKESDHANENLEEFKGASFGGSVSNLATTTVGAGIMALPAAMKVLGLGPGLAMIILLALLTEASIDMLVRFSRPGRCTSYGAVMGEEFGKVGKILLQIVVIIKTIGVLIVYMIIIGDALSGTSLSAKGPHNVGVFEGWFGTHWWNGRAFVLFVTTVVVFVPLASLKRIDSLKYTSAISVALAVVFVVITAYVAVVKLIDHSLSKPRWLPHVTNLASVWKLFTSVPVLVTAFICHYNVHSIQNELQKPSQMQNVARTSVTLCTSIYLLTSTFGFLLFGESTLGDVLANFDKNLGIRYSSVLNDVIRVSYAVHLMLVFPVIFFALRLNIDGLIFPSKRPLLSDVRRFALITVVLIGVIFVGANFIPSIWDAFQFTGATAAVCIGFIFPAAIVLRDRHGIATKKDKILGVIMIVLAVFCSLVAIYSNLSSLFKRN